MNKPALKYIVLSIFIIILIPTVIIPFFNKQKELKSDISEYEEILSAIDEQTGNKTNTLYEEYMQSVLGTYDEREPKDLAIQSALENVDDIVDKIDLTDYKEIKADINKPTIDFSVNGTGMIFSPGT